MSLESAIKVGGTSPIFHAAYPEEDKALQPTDAKVKNFVLRIFEAIGDFFYRLFQKLAGYFVLPAQINFIFAGDNLPERKDALRKDFGGKDLTFETADDVKLDGMYFEGKGCEKSDRTMILFNGNGVRYEQFGGDTVLFDISSWQSKGWNVVVFNYRGVGESGGTATRDGLILDGDAALQYVRDHLKVPEENILLHGHSLGGGVASEVAARNPKVNYCNDRSFSSLSVEAKLLLGNGCLGNFAKNALTYFGWEFNARDNWDKIEGKKIAIYHENDGIIKPGARFHETLEKEAAVIKMTPGLVNAGFMMLADGPGLFDKYFGAQNPSPGIYQLPQKEEVTPQQGQIAHMRRFNSQDEKAYFAAINTIGQVAKDALAIGVKEETVD